MSVHFSLRRMANTVLVVVGAFLIGGVLHRSVVTGQTELLAGGSIARIVLGAAILVVAYSVRVPREEREAAWGREDEEDGAGGEEA